MFFISNCIVISSYFSFLISNEFFWTKPVREQSYNNRLPSFIIMSAIWQRFYLEFSLYLAKTFSQYLLQLLIRLACELSSLSSFLAVKPIGTWHVKLWQSNNGLGGSAWSQIVRIDVGAKSWHKAAWTHTRTAPPQCQLSKWPTPS